jgi:hypothetical protein
MKKEIRNDKRLLVPRLCLGTHCMRGSASHFGKADLTSRHSEEPCLCIVWLSTLVSQLWTLLRTSND